jgi:hypothetical protein
MTAAEMTTTWAQVRGWRLGRQLLDPVEQVDAADVVRRLCGVQAQVPGAAALAIGVRQADPVPGAMDEALRKGRLMRTWAMRGTLHLLAPDEAGAYLSLMAAGRSWEKGSWVRNFGVTPEGMAELTAAVADVLDDQVLTREQFVAELADRLGHDGLAEQLRSGWGAVLKPVAWQGALCNAPAEGNRVLFARPDRLLPTWKGVPPPDQAAPIVIAAYLRAYGPATVERFDAWLTRNSSSKPRLRGWFAALGDRLVTVDVEGTPSWVLAEDADELAAAAPAPPTTVRLLPGFDQYVLGPGTAATEILAPERRSEVSRTAGWIAPTVIAAGRVTGVWDVDGGTLTTQLFDDTDVGDVVVPPAELAAAVDRMQSVLAAVTPT